MTHPTQAIEALEVAKACIARWHDTTSNHVIENIMTTDVADIIKSAIDEATATYAAKLAAEQAMCDQMAGALREVISFEEAFHQHGSNLNGQCGESPKWVCRSAITAYTAHKEGR